LFADYEGILDLEINMASEQSLQRAAQAWCTATTSDRIMDPPLAEAFAHILETVADETSDSVLVPREVLQRIDEYLSCYRDEGASDEGWASDQLQLDRAIVSLLLRQPVENTE
jgi:hypothetical protein